MTTEDGAPPGPARPHVGPPRTATPDDGDQGPQPGAVQDPAAARHRPAGNPAEAGRTPGAPAPTPARRQKQRKSFLRELPGIVLTALVISVLIKTFLVQAFYIPSGSMENTLLVDDRVLVNKLADKPDEIHRGDVVVFRDPGGWLAGGGERVDDGGGVGGAIRDALVFVGLAPAAGEEDLIKRVIGLGGDQVEGRDGKVYVNGVVLDEPYLYPGDQATEQTFDVDVPEGSVWVMGDHRSVSEDSRAHNEQGEGVSGFVPVDEIIGRAFTIVWPVDRAHLLRVPDTFDQPGLARSGG